MDTTELGERLQKLYEYRQMREQWAQMAYVNAKASAMGGAKPSEAQLAAETQAHDDWQRARADFETIKQIWEEAQRLSEQSHSQKAA